MQRCAHRCRKSRDYFLIYLLRPQRRSIMRVSYLRRRVNGITNSMSYWRISRHWHSFFFCWFSAERYLGIKRFCVFSIDTIIFDDGGHISHSTYINQLLALRSTDTAPSVTHFSEKCSFKVLTRYVIQVEVQRVIRTRAIKSREGERSSYWHLRITYPNSKAEVDRVCGTRDT